ncbi:hypothetical protein EON65_49565 [archaeon]|nr:MAG: hypothetical protein EON65_49565 [archaeon]
MGGARYECHSRLGMTGRYLATKEILKLGGEASQDECDGFYDLIERGVDDIYTYMSTSSYPLVLTDGRGCILHSNSAWESLCGYSLGDIQGHTSSFLQGDMTCKKGIREIDEKLRTGLGSQVKVINYRGDTGEAFENIFTIIPVYDWLKEREENLARRRTGGVYRGGGLGVCYSGGIDSFVYTKQSEKFMHPSHFVGKLEGVCMRPDLPRKPVFQPVHHDGEGMRIRVEEVGKGKFRYAM